jgi:hypothetical protein
MSFPRLRVRISPAESLLLMPGLDTVVNGLAEAKLGAFPHRHPYDRIDFIASAVYEDRAYDDEMATRVINLRWKLREIPQSRKIRVDSVDLAVAAFALRLWKTHKPSDVTEETSAGVKPLEAKLERYRQRAKRAAIKTSVEGNNSYQETAERWRRFASWAKYHLLYFKLPNNRQPWRAKFWKDQRQQLTMAITAALGERFFEVPNDAEMPKLVTLLTRSLRCCRHPMGLGELLQTPQSHTDFLVAFVQKRVELKPLPGAPVPLWQALSDRGAIFSAYQRRRLETGSPHSGANLQRAIARMQSRLADTPVKALPSGFTLKGEPITAENVCDGMAEFLYQSVTVRFGLTRDVCEQAQFLIQHGNLDEYRVPTTAMSFEGLLVELRPADFDGHRIDVIVVYAEWLLKVLFALGQKPEWMREALTGAWVRAKRLEEKADYDGWVASRAYGSQSDEIDA